MLLRSVRRAVALWLLLAATAAQTASAQTYRRELAPGVVYTQEVVPPPAGPLVWNVLRIDPKAPGVRIQAALGRDVMLTDEPAKGRETVGDLATRRGALAAINADFFPFTGRPLGLTIVDGELVAEGLPFRAVVGVTADGQVRFDRLMAVGALRCANGTMQPLDGINRLPEKDEITLLTPRFGARMRAPAACSVVGLGALSGPVRPGVSVEAVAGQAVPGDPNAPLAPGGAALVGAGKGADWLRAQVRAGDRVSLRFDLASVPEATAQARGVLASRAASLRAGGSGSVWTDVAQAVGGGPWLVHDGRPAVDGVAEGFSQKEFVDARHPRTAVGSTASGELLLVTVDGRQPQSRGVSLSELAERMAALGAMEAINLDGGGSTTMVVQGLYVNAPSDGAPRPVADALLVFGQGSSPAPILTMPQQTLAAGGRVRIEAGAADALFGSAEGRVFVDQGGFLTSPRASAGVAVALTRDARVCTPYRIQPGAPARVTAHFEKAPNDPPDRSVLVVQVADRYGNGVPGQRVAVAATGGVPDRAEALTDDAGRAEIEIVWDRDAGRAATVRTAGLPPVRVSAGRGQPGS